MVIMGVEEGLQEPLVSNASCTTNSAAPLVALLDDLCGIESCYITTVHSYTLDQHLQDALTETCAVHVPQGSILYLRLPELPDTYAHFPALVGADWGVWNPRAGARWLVD